MTPGKVRAVTVVQKAAQVQGMLRGVGSSAGAADSRGRHK
jgi:hypothetical protein